MTKDDLFKIEPIEGKITIENINKMRNKSGKRLLDKMWNDLWWTGELKNVKL